MEEQNKSVIAPSVKYGLLLGIVLIAFSLLMFVLDVDRESKLMYISYLLMVGGIFWAMVNFRDSENGGFITYGKAFGVGFWTVLIASLVTTIFTYIYVTMLDPGMIEEILVKAEESILESNPDISDEELDQALSITEAFTSPLMISLFGFIANVIFGTILSLIIAIFARREGESFPE